MSNRRDFIKKTALGTIGISTVLGCKDGAKSKATNTISCRKSQKKTLIISSWNHGLPANEVACKQLKVGKSGIEAIEAGVKIPEGDPSIRNVGYGGYPDRERKVTIYACIIYHNSNCGSVSFLEGIKHPISVAKRVLEHTPHVMLSVEGTLQFELSEGFVEENLLTKDSERDRENCLEASKKRPVINIENHDTISMLMIGQAGNLS